MSSRVKTPILIRYNDKILRIMEIAHGKDGSIYFFLPRKKGYVIDTISEKKFYKKNFYEGIKRIFKTMSKRYKNPYISFHPGKKVVHINTSNNHVKNDYDIYNAAQDGSMLCFLVELITPNDYLTFDEYAKNIDRTTDLIINDFTDIEGNILDLSAGNLEMDFYIHSSDIEIFDDPLPQLNKHRRFKNILTFSNDTGYSITLCLYQLEKDANKLDTTAVVGINTKDKNILYTMKAL